MIGYNKLPNIFNFYTTEALIVNTQYFYQLNIKIKIMTKEGKSNKTKLIFEFKNPGWKIVNI